MDEDIKTCKNRQDAAHTQYLQYLFYKFLVSCFVFGKIVLHFFMRNIDLCLLCHTIKTMLQMQKLLQKQECQTYLTSSLSFKKSRRKNFRKTNEVTLRTTRGHCIE